jgi:hypothetical protein
MTGRLIRRQDDAVTVYTSQCDSYSCSSWCLRVLASAAIAVAAAVAWSSAAAVRAPAAVVAAAALLAVAALIAVTTQVTEGGSVGGCSW